MPWSRQTDAGRVIATRNCDGRCGVDLVIRGMNSLGGVQQPPRTKIPYREQATQVKTERKDRKVSQAMQVKTERKDRKVSQAMQVKAERRDLKARSAILECRDRKVRSGRRAIRAIRARPCCWLWRATRR